MWWGKFRIAFDRPCPVTRGIAAFSRFPWSWTSFGDGGFFVRRSVHDRMGGFERIPLFEDVRFFSAMRAMGKVAVIPLEIVTSAHRFRERGALRQLLSNTGLWLAHQLGASPYHLAARYQGTEQAPAAPLKEPLA